MKCFLWFGHKWLVKQERHIDAGISQYPEFILQCEYCGNIKFVSSPWWKQ